VLAKLFYLFAALCCFADMDVYDDVIMGLERDQNLLVDPPRGRSLQRRAGSPARRERSPVNYGQIVSAFRSIGSTYERVRELETEISLLRDTNSELQESVFIVQGDLQEARTTLSTVTQERDTAREELELFKMTKEEILGLSLDKLAAGQIAIASAHNIYVSEMTRRVDEFVSNADFSQSKYMMDCCAACKDKTNMPNMALQCGHTVCQSCSLRMEQPIKCPHCRCISTQLVRLFGLSQV